MPPKRKPNFNIYRFSAKEKIKKPNKYICKYENCERSYNRSDRLKAHEVKCKANPNNALQFQLSTPHSLARALSGNLSRSSSSALAIPRGDEETSVYSSFGGSPSGSTGYMNTDNASSAGLTPLGSVNPAEDILMDNGSFHDVPTSGSINRNEDTPMVSALSGLFPNDSEHYEDSTTDNGVSFDLPSSEPAHSSNEESDDKDEDED